MAGLEGKLIAAGLKHGVPVAGDWIESELRDRGVLPEKNAETLFVDTLRDELETAAQQSEGDTAHELYSVVLNWDVIEAELADLDTAFDTEESAVAEIVETLKDAPETEFSVADDETLRRVVTRAYRETITTYAERLAGTEFAEEFQIQTEIRLSEQVQSIADRLDEVVGRTTPTARYDSYDPDDPEAVETLVDRVVETERERFVDRLEFDGAPDAERLLVVGPAGSGKSRVLGELIERTADEGRVSRIVTPTDGLVSQRDEWAFEYETFDGDVLLVWDDIHRIAESGETDAFESVVSALSGVLDEQGHDLHVLCAARSGNVDNLPRVASVESIRRKQKGLWEPFEVLELDDLGNDPLGEIADVRAAVHGVAFGTEAARAALVEKASGPSAPEYVDAVLRTQTDGTDADRVLTEGDVAETPDSIADIWYEQFYDVLDDDELAVLEACKLLYDVNIPYLVPLVRAVWTEVFGKDGGKRAFADAVESLVARDWVVLVGDGPLADEALLWMHDTQCETVEREIAAYVSDVSSVLTGDLGEVSDHVSDDVLIELNRRFADGLREVRDGWPDVRDEHYRWALRESSESGDILDSGYTVGHSNYGVLLAKTDQPEKAEDHYRQALVEDSETDDPLDSEYVNAHSNYGTLLAEMPRPGQAEDHYRRALVESSKTGDPLDSTDAETHLNYGNLLDETGRPEEAEDHYRQALLERSETEDPLDSTYVEAHSNYGILLAETNRHEKAEEHYRRALLETTETDNLLDSTDAKTHSNYGALLAKTNRPEKAEEHLRRALLETSKTDDPLESTDANAHSNYGNILQRYKKFKRSEKHYRRALLETIDTDDPLDSKYAGAHSNYGALLSKMEQPKKAEKHLRRALLVTSETDSPLDSTKADSHSNYGKLMQKNNSLDKAEEHYRQALLVTSKTDDPLDSTYAEAHHNYGTLLLAEERLSEARSHAERSIELWQEQDRPQNVLNDSKLLVMTCDRLNDHDAAINHCERAIELAHEIGDIETEREFRERYARLDGRDVSDKVSEQYGFALQAVVRRDFETAAELFGAACRHREDFSDHQPPYWMTIAGGLWLRALVPVSEVTMDDETDTEIRSTVESATDSLSITTRELYRWLYDEGALSAPAHLRMSVTDDDTITQLELEAYETLVQLLEQ